MAKKQFKAESKRLLDLMINSIYTHKEIFLRELISNASDAIDKLYFKSLTETSIDTQDLGIEISLDKQARTLTISDNGIGMTEDELNQNLGTIAKSGSLQFKNDNELKDGVDIIGQFGVGFYSAFMVSDDVTVVSRSYDSDTAFKWHSNGADGYTIEPCEKDSRGTEIILKIKPNTDEESYDEFLEQYRIQGIVKKYSDYIRYPIKMDMTKTVPTEEKDENGAPKYETVTERETLNSMIPVWKKSKSELADDEYDNFYKEKFMDYEAPLKAVHTKTEGTATYNALLFIPSHAPFNYYSKEYEKGLQLYANGVMIMDKCPDLIPDCFSFVKGLVDSEDLSLNISREMLQHDRQLKLIERSLEKKIKSELSKMLKNERDDYEKFYKAFGLQLKFGLYQSYGANKDLLADLLMFHSSSEGRLVTLDEYIDRMKEDQKEIYYAAGESVARIDALPQTELVKDKGFEILYFTDDVDEFAIQMLGQYKDKQFKSISSGDLNLETEEEKSEYERLSSENSDMLKFMADSLSGKLDSVAVSKRLKTHPVCLTSEGGLSIEMEKVLNTMPAENKVSAKKVLEINPSHPIFETLKSLYGKDNEKLKEYCLLLYDQALLIEGMPVEDPVEFSNRICALMADK